MHLLWLCLKVWIEPLLKAGVASLFPSSFFCIFYIVKNTISDVFQKSIDKIIWSSGTMDCTCMLFWFKNRVLFVRKRASVV